MHKTESQKPKIALFASGNGSNVQAIIDAIDQHTLDASIELLVCDKEHAYVIERAVKAGIDVFTFQAKSFSSKEEYETLIFEKLKAKKVEWLVLAGYMRLIGKVLLHAYEKKNHQYPSFSSSLVRRKRCCRSGN